VIILAWLIAGAAIWYVFVQFGLKFAALCSEEWPPKPTEGVCARPVIRPSVSHQDRRPAQRVTLRAA
jgi:hypothetical protein